MKFIVGKKQEMTQVFKEDGTVVPVTKVVAGPCFITQVKSEKKDGYNAIQIGCGEKKRLNKSLLGHLKGLVKAADLRECEVSQSEIEKYKRGDEIKVTVFEQGEKVLVTGISKGKGFAGVVKRHGFHGAPASHGTKDQLRHGGSIGATGPARVFKGMKMPGNMGVDQVTVKNLEIIEIDSKNNILFIKGAVPGARNSLVMIKSEGEMDLNKEVVKDVKADQEAVTKEDKATEEVAEEVKEVVKEKEVKEVDKKEATSTDRSASAGATEDKEPKKEKKEKDTPVDSDSEDKGKKE